MKTLLTTLLAALALGSCDWDAGVQGSGHVVTTQKQIGSFTEVSSRGAFRIEWQSGPPSLSVTTDDNLMELFEARNVGNRLELRTRERVRPTRGIKVTISGPSLSGAKVSGTVDLIAHGLSGPTFAVQSAGAGTIVLDGTVDQLLADLTGASELKAKSLQSKIAEISTTGAAEAWVTATEKLRVVITGAGDVSYSGNPPIIEKRITGAGTIHHKD